jgi:hypothetical protein
MPGRQPPASSIVRTENVSRTTLYYKYCPRIRINPVLTRSLVSYQSNRSTPFYRWLKYKEGFSAELVDYVITKVAPNAGCLLDPFAGSGAALFGARERGLDATGIELLPVGLRAIEARLAAQEVQPSEFQEYFDLFEAGDWKVDEDPALRIRHLTITEGAFATTTERDIARFRTFVRDRIRTPNIRLLFDFACLAVLESVSFTRKDGQYLRWDERAPRKLRGKEFNKGRILSLKAALEQQLRRMADDLTAAQQFPLCSAVPRGKTTVTQGSCLTMLPMQPVNSVDVLLTSPPYCNRYDYTRTYALELAYLNVDEAKLKELRQALLSCTVENRAKVNELGTFYEGIGKRQIFAEAMRAFEQQAALQETLAVLEAKNAQGLLNNTNVPRMIRNYFLEMALVIFEFARIVRPGGSVVMINDNVQYGGEEIPVDLILSDMAASAGLETKHIWTLGRGKGNSSQQMGAHGRNELRKCAYVWNKPRQ